MNKELRLTPINPFTPRQRDVIREILDGVTANKQIAKNTGMSVKTVSIHISGFKSVKDATGEMERSTLGVFGVIEKITDERPFSKNELIQILLGDVVFLREEEASDPVGDKSGIMPA